MQESTELTKKYLRFPPPYRRIARLNRLTYSIAGLFLFPVFWLLAYTRKTPGLNLRIKFAKRGAALLLKGDYTRAHGLLVAPLDSVRYFEFEFMWNAVRKLRPTSYLDVSSPRMLPLMILEQYKDLVADLVNPDKSDLPETQHFAELFKLTHRCRFHEQLIEEAPLQSNSFSLITSMSVVEHIPDDTGAIQKMWDLLEPGGMLLLSVPCAAKASEEYTNLNDYGLIEKDESGFVFWQRYYDESLLQQRIFNITGLPIKRLIYAEKKAGLYNQNVEQKRSNPYYPSWREPWMMGQEFVFKEAIEELPGMGVIAMEFIKPR